MSEVRCMKNVTRTQGNVSVSLELLAEGVLNQCKHIISQLYINFRMKLRMVERRRILQSDMDLMKNTFQNIRGKVMPFFHNFR